MTLPVSGGVPPKMFCSECCQFVDPEGHRWECLPVSAETRALAQKVVDQMALRRPETPEEIEAWAQRLAEQMSKYND